MSLFLTLYVAGCDDEMRASHASLERALRESLPPDSWQLNVIDVLQLPEKALQDDVFATPTLLRSLPTPLVRVIGDIAQTQRVLAIIQSSDAELGGTLIL